MNTVNKAPHHDISALEVESAQRFCEHLLHMQRSQRQILGTLGQQLSQLQHLHTILEECQSGELAPQVNITWQSTHLEHEVMLIRLWVEYALLLVDLQTALKQPSLRCGLEASSAAVAL